MRSVIRTPFWFALALTTLAVAPAHSQSSADYPNGPVKILVPFAAGGPTDVVARILGDGQRQKTRAFSELQSYYLFVEKFGRPAKGND